MSQINPIIQWWMTPKLPSEHVNSNLSGLGFMGSLKLLFRKWFVHPVKRRFAKYYLVFLRKFTDIKVIGITGSAGKTTTKEMVASILKLEGKTVFSKDNIDPIFNIPTTILNTKPGTRYLILEMGVEYKGEMDFYLWLAKPDIGVITNIFPTHTEFFGDANGVFKEKSKLIKGLNKNGIGVLNYKDKFLKRLKNTSVEKIVWFGDGAEVMSSLETFKNNGTSFRLVFDLDENKNTTVDLPITGNQFVQNALAAASIAKALGISLEKIKQGLESFNSAKHRMTVIKHRSGAIILDDSYNNNPKAAMEAIKTFETFAERRDKVVVFGDMLELGELNEKYHRKLGDVLGKLNLVRLICVGKNSKLTAETAAKILGKNFVVHVDSVDNVYENLKGFLKKNTIILVKGSRSIHLDLLIDRLNK